MSTCRTARAGPPPWWRCHLSAGLLRLGWIRLPEDDSWTTNIAALRSLGCKTSVRETLWGDDRRPILQESKTSRPDDGGRRLGSRELVGQRPQQARSRQTRKCNDAG